MCDVAELKAEAKRIVDDVLAGNSIHLQAAPPQLKLLAAPLCLAMPPPSLFRHRDLKLADKLKRNDEKLPRIYRAIGRSATHGRLACWHARPHAGRVARYLRVARGLAPRISGAQRQSLRAQTRLLEYRPGHVPWWARQRAHTGTHAVRVSECAPVPDVARQENPASPLIVPAPFPYVIACRRGPI